MKDFESIGRALAKHPAQLESGETEDGQRKRRAAVAMVLRPAGGDGPGLDVLFIERAEFAGDPWSGHMAFPGGRVEESDEGPRHAAERETLEEVSVTLAGAELLGQLDDLRGRHAGREIPMVISAYVYAVRDPAPLEPNHEVAEAFWFPIEDLLDPERRTHYGIRGLRFPGILVGEPGRHIVWGLTYRFLENFFEKLEVAMPDRWGDVAEFRDGSDEDIAEIEKRMTREP